MRRGIALLLVWFATPAWSDSAMPEAEFANVQLADRNKERQAKALMDTIRCVVCQGQSIGDSDAEMAGDMRSLIRKRIAAGEKPEAIRAWLIERYGSYITYDPPLSRWTAPVLIAPVLLLIAGAALAARRFRRRR